MSHTALADGIRRLRSKLTAEQRHDDSDEHLLNAFAAAHDEHAFAVLVRRHGPMVLHVCRGVLGHEQDAEDAFQATFLVLARNAAALRKKTALASFLHGTAYRLALSTRRSAARRRKHQVQAPSRSNVQSGDELSWREVRALLDEEIARLPEKYRSVFVLCCLEELSRSEVGTRLGLKERTVLSRLAVARKRLAQRLAHRGVELTAVLTASGLTVSSASALPPGLVASTIRGALATALGERLTKAVAAPVAELIEGATAAFVTKTKIVALLVLAVSLLAGAGVWSSGGFLTLSGGRQPPESGETRGADAPRSAKRETERPREIHGCVLGPDGKPKVGATRVLLDSNGPRELGETAADGRFAVVLPREIKDGGSAALLARSSDAGLDFISLAGWNAAKPVELRLVKDQAIRGRVVNTEGKPIRGVRVSVSDIDVYANNSLESFFVLWQKRPADYAVPPGEKTLLFGAGPLLETVTDAEGRFAISGVGAERVARLRLQGGGIATMMLRIVNRDGFDPKPFNQPADDAYRLVPKMQNPPSVGMLLQGPKVAIVAETEKPIRGIIKDADSGKGVPNRVVRLVQRDYAFRSPFTTTKTDAQGRFEFRGARKEKTYSLFVEADSSLGYLATETDAADTVGYSPLTVELRLKKGVIVTGKIIDKTTGKAVSGFAQFEILINNPFAKDYPGVQTHQQYTTADGTFRVVTIPGPVLLMGGYYPAPTRYGSSPVVLISGQYAPSSSAFDYIEFSKYRPPVADPEYPQYFSKLPGSRSGDVGVHAYGGGIGLIQGGYCKVLDIKPGTKSVHQDILLERASVLEVKIQDADAKLITGVWATDFATHTFIDALWIERSTCPVYGLEARKPRLLIFYEPTKKIIGSRRLEGHEKGPLVVELGAMATVKGRLLDNGGKPLADAVVTAAYRDPDAIKMHRLIHASKRIVTGANGAFTLDELIPEMKFDLSFRRGRRLFRGVTRSDESATQVKAGECRDLGAITSTSVAEKSRK